MPTDATADEDDPRMAILDPEVERHCLTTFDVPWSTHELTGMVYKNLPDEAHHDKQISFAQAKAWVDAGLFNNLNMFAEHCVRDPKTGEFKPPVAKVVCASVDTKDLIVKYVFADTPEGRAMHDLVRNKQMHGLSLQHRVSCGDNGRPLEISICKNPARGYAHTVFASVPPEDTKSGASPAEPAVPPAPAQPAAPAAPAAPARRNYAECDSVAVILASAPEPAASAPPAPAAASSPPDPTRSTVTPTDPSLEKSQPLWCEDCGTPVTLCHGEKIGPYFRHKPVAPPPAAAVAAASNAAPAPPGHGAPANVTTGAAPAAGAAPVPPATAAAAEPAPVPPPSTPEAPVTPSAPAAAAGPVASEPPAAAGGSAPMEIDPPANAKLCDTGQTSTETKSDATMASAEAGTDTKQSAPPAPPAADQPPRTEDKDATPAAAADSGAADTAMETETGAASAEAKAPAEEQPEEDEKEAEPEAVPIDPKLYTALLRAAVDTAFPTADPDVKEMTLAQALATPAYGQKLLLRQHMTPEVKTPVVTEPAAVPPPAVPTPAVPTPVAPRLQTVQASKAMQQPTPPRTSQPVKRALAPIGTSSSAPASKVAAGAFDRGRGAIQRVVLASAATKVAYNQTGSATVESELAHLDKGRHWRAAVTTKAGILHKLGSFLEYTNRYANRRKVILASTETFAHDPDFPNYVKSGALVLGVHKDDYHSDLGVAMLRATL
jgi:hypothetical protein